MSLSRAISNTGFETLSKWLGSVETHTVMMTSEALQHPFNLKVGRSSDSEEHEGSEEEFQYSNNKQNISAIFFKLQTKLLMQFVKTSKHKYSHWFPRLSLLLEPTRQTQALGPLSFWLSTDPRNALWVLRIPKTLKH